jgi:glycosyltransferase involved in cell wall biosynthesis
MTLLYLTQDRVGAASGGGRVTGLEREVLASLGEDLVVLDGSKVSVSEDPFESDERYCWEVRQFIEGHGAPRFAHVYAGCFTMTVEYLKSKGIKVSYSVDPHDPDLSIEEAEHVGKPYPYRHMSDLNQRAMYLKGYVLADVVIVPSTNGERIMKSFGCKNVVRIPHSVRPFREFPLPEKFTVGHMSQGGPDKGLRYLLEAWKALDLKGARLLFAGECIDWVDLLWRKIGGCNIEVLGYIDKEEKFYKQVSVYVQPSVTEGFGVPVIEAMACGRPVIVSDGAGAVDAVASAPDRIGDRIPIRDPQAIADAIRFYHDNPEEIRERGRKARAHSESYAESHIKEKYLSIWRFL